MRRAWWLGLGGVLVLCLAACEVDEGEGGDGGTSDTGDTGGDGGGPTPLCADNQEYQDSCLAQFFTSCFEPAGTCSFVERTAVGFDEVSAIVWQNGAEWEERYDTVTSSLDIIVRSSATAQCFTALDETEGPNGERENISFTPEAGGGALNMTIDASGNMVVECPGGNPEAYNATEAAAALNCLGMVCNGETLRDRRE